MDTVKEEAINAISKLSDSADMDDIMYRLYVLDKVRKGEEAIRRGEQLSVEDLKKEMAQW